MVKETYIKVIIKVEGKSKSERIFLTDVTKRNCWDGGNIAFIQECAKILVEDLLDKFKK